VNIKEAMGRRVGAEGAQATAFLGCLATLLKPW